MQDYSNDKSNPTAVFTVLSIIVVGIVVIIFAGLYIASRLAGSDDSQGATIPYGIAARPVPDVNRAADILPEKLGGFKRGPISGDIQNYSATYINGADKIDVSGSQGVSLRAAQASVASIDQPRDASGHIQRQLNKDPSFVLISGPSLFRLAWSHNRWFFDVKANSQAALDAFMRVFKY